MLARIRFTCHYGQAEIESATLCLIELLALIPLTRIERIPQVLQTCALPVTQKWQDNCPFIDLAAILAPHPRVELGTYRLTADCSAIELVRNISEVGFEPTIFCSQNRRHTKLAHSELLQFSKALPPLPNNNVKITSCQGYF